MKYRWFEWDVVYEIDFSLYTVVKDDSDLEDLDDSSENSQLEHDNNSEQADQDDTDEIKDIQDAFGVCLLTESKIVLKAYRLIIMKAFSFYLW